MTISPLLQVIDTQGCSVLFNRHLRGKKNVKRGALTLGLCGDGIPPVQTGKKMEKLEYTGNVLQEPKKLSPFLKVTIALWESVCLWNIYTSYWLWLFSEGEETQKRPHYSHIRYCMYCSVYVSGYWHRQLKKKGSCILQVIPSSGFLPHTCSRRLKRWFWIFSFKPDFIWWQMLFHHWRFLADDPILTSQISGDPRWHL